MKLVSTIKLAFTIVLYANSVLIAQVSPTPAIERLNGIEKKKLLQSKSLVNNLHFKSIGPSIMSGRVVDVDVNPDDPSIFYVAFASGGLWKTINNGQSFTPIFDDQAVITIGDIAVDWKNNRIWVGTGENNSSRSSFSGVGVFVSNDDGKTWNHRGLEESQHIGRIILHPSNPDIAWVAVIGHLYTDNPERGVYKTTDGGKSWKKQLYVDDHTGAIDLIMDPQDPNQLYASTWDRSRRAWNLTESGKGSGIYSSIDGGDTWKLLSTELSGFPIGESCGRIGLSLSKKAKITYLYAVVDNQAKRPKEDKEEKKEELVKSDFKQMTKEDFLKIPTLKLKKYLKENDFPDKYTVDKVRDMIKNDKIKPSALNDYLEDANTALFSSDEPIKGAEIYRSEDNGKSWHMQNSKNLDGLFNSYGYYFGQIRTEFDNPDRVYIQGVPMLTSEDGGITWKSIDGDNVHGDYHALWLNPKRKGHIISGSDGGVNISYDYGKTWIKCNTPSVGQFNGIAVDMEKPFNVYGGLQDNGVWTGSSTNTESLNWYQSGNYGYKSILGGDGMQVQVDTRNNKTVYTGFQFGNYFRVNKTKKTEKYISPKHDLGERPLRFNWETPIYLSSFNMDILYMGANKLYRSMNQGKDWEAISDDLTNGGKPGDVPYGTLSAIHESPLKYGLIYTGSDDGKVSITKDGGDVWTDISKGLPQGLWVSKIQASKYEKPRVYISLSGYRNDNFAPYLYISEDYGTSWKNIGTDLPMEPVNVIKEDPNNENLLYVGTDNGLYISLDRGQNFMSMNKDLPNVAIHDLVPHPRDHTLVVGTHGRSLYTVSTAELDKLTPENIKKEVLVFDIASIRKRSWGKQSTSWSEPNIPKVAIPIYTKFAGIVSISILDKENNKLKTWEVKTDMGLNYPEYDCTIDPSIVNKYEKYLNSKLKENEDPIKIKKADNGMFYLEKANYNCIVTKGTEKVETEFKIE